MVKLYRQPGMLIEKSKLLPRRSGAHVREKTLGVVDIGSNTVHLLVAKTDGRHVEPIVDESEGLQLGADVDYTGALSDEKLQALVVTLVRFRDQAVAQEATEIHLLATQALRIATNRAAVLKELESKLELPVDILTPQLEAEFAFLGADLACPSVGPQVMVDIGGGSMQVAVGQNGDVWDSVSLPLGASRVASQFLPSDPPTYLQEAELVTYLAQAIPSVLPLPDTNITGVLGVGGTLRRSPSLLKLQIGDMFPPNALELMLANLRGRTTDEITTSYDLRPERARLLMPALLVLREVMRGYDYPSLIMAPYGVREGAILSLAREH
jgi:exopolyphosphatase/guanosine-5'-triphosphate,3'-diphosphate pyrophosphatase